MFMQFYSTLAKTVWGYTDELSMGFCNEKIIKPFEEEEIMRTPRSRRTHLLLNQLAVKLRNGDVVLINKIMKMLQVYKKDTDLEQLASRMLEALNQTMPSGMYDVMHVFIYICMYLMS